MKPNNVDLLIKLGKINEKLRDFDEAIVNLKKALRRDKTNFVAQYRIGCLYNRNNMREEGIEALKAAHYLDPEDVDTHLKLGEIYLRDDSALDEAEEILKKAIEIRYVLPEAHISLGRVYEKKGNEDLSMKEL